MHEHGDPTTPAIVVVAPDAAAHSVASCLRAAGHEVVTSDAAGAADAVDGCHPALVVVAVGGADEAGFAVLERLASTRVLALVADGSATSRQRALSLGAADTVGPPCDSTQLLPRVRNLLALWHLRDSLEAAGEEPESIGRAYLDVLERLAMLAEYRDPEHTRRMGRVAAAIAAELGWDDRRQADLAKASPLHDLGKIGVPEQILLKPEALTPEEFEVMKTHVRLGSKILGTTSSRVLGLAEEVARTHHEHWDGSGYPLGLSGTAIPESGRVVAVADAFDTMLSDTSYKPSRGAEEAIQEVRAERGRQFDPAVVDALERALASGAIVAHAHEGLAAVSVPARG